MSDPSVATKTCPECGSENVADAITCNNPDCTHIFAGDEDAFAAAPPMPEVEEPTSMTSAAEPEPAMAPAPPMAESATPVMAPAEPPAAPAAPEYAAPTIQPPPAPMPPAGSAPATYAPPTMTTPPPYTPPPSGVPMGAPSTGKDKLVAGLLAIFLGSFGAHQFYLGKIGLGIAYLAVWIVGLFLCGIPSIIVGGIALVQGIMYLIATPEDFERKYVIEGKFF